MAHAETQLLNYYYSSSIDPSNLRGCLWAFFSLPHIQTFSPLDQDLTVDLLSLFIFPQPSSSSHVSTCVVAPSSAREGLARAPRCPPPTRGSGTTSRTHGSSACPSRHCLYHGPSVPVAPLLAPRGRYHRHSHRCPRGATATSLSAPATFAGPSYHLVLPLSPAMEIAGAQTPTPYPNLTGDGERIEKWVSERIEILGE